MNIKNNQSTISVKQYTKNIEKAEKQLEKHVMTFKKVLEKKGLKDQANQVG